MSVESEIVKAAAAIKAQDSSAESLALIRRIVADDRGQKLVDELLGQARTAQGSEEYYDSVDKAYNALTVLFNHEKFSALILLAYLWPFADNTYIGYIWDSIGIYLGENMSDELKAEFSKIVFRTTDESMRKFYEDWSTLPTTK